jgi:hypothetical protein
VRYGDLALPIGFEVVHKDIHFCDLKTKKERRRDSVTKNEYFRQLTRQALMNQVKFEYILSDNWFGAKDNMESIHKYLKKKFIILSAVNRVGGSRTRLPSSHTTVRTEPYTAVHDHSDQTRTILLIDK